MVGIRGKTTRMSGWTRLQLFWTVLSHGHRLCGAHVAGARIRGAWRTTGPLPYGEFHKKNWKLRCQPTSNQVEAMRRDGINGGPNLLS
jgi:hypothetical protein